MELNQQSLLEQYSTPKTTLNKRQQFLQQFQEKLNKERGEYKPLTGKDLGMLMSYIKTEDLYDFYKQCEAANSFSKFWWYTIKPKKP